MANQLLADSSDVTFPEDLFEFIVRGQGRQIKASSNLHGTGNDGDQAGSQPEK
jgi:hypothetical protein